MGDDLDACANPVRAYAALYIGGMGSREKNFYNDLAARMGYEEQAKQVQDLYLSKDYGGAAAAVPMEFIDRTALVGPPERIRDRLAAYAEAGVTTLSVAVYAGDLEERLATIRRMPELLAEAGLAS
jgi:Luciferase-like monooxygenase.